ncbi:SPT2 chromatin protein [Striga asiatica]|uniref:SPT2 chromatin protein n=1 Tax=Striga asiatica TaxID=4170 RepID=A0A5A7R0S6_STRAF|nr:SPT2 chromatin protein [Striga asiatica]
MQSLSSSQNLQMGLALRQQLKEVYRARLRKENHHAVAGATSQAVAPASDNYGRLFGPSEPVIAARVVEEAKHWLQSPKRLNKFFGDEKLFAANTPEKVPKILDKIEREKKVSWLKESRDYSFLSGPENHNSRPVPSEIPKETKNSGPDKKRISAKSPLGEISRKDCEVVLPRPKIKKEIIRRPKIQARNCSKKEESCEEAIGIIRRMFGYDPTKYKNDDVGADISMEANFRDIEKEERRSAKIASKEDAEEFRKLMGNSKKIKRR